MERHTCISCNHDCVDSFLSCITRMSQHILWRGVGKAERTLLHQCSLISPSSHWRPVPKLGAGMWEHLEIHLLHCEHVQVCFCAYVYVCICVLCVCVFVLCGIWAFDLMSFRFCHSVPHAMEVSAALLLRPNTCVFIITLRQTLCMCVFFTSHLWQSNTRQYCTTLWWTQWRVPLTAVQVGREEKGLE